MARPVERGRNCLGADLDDCRSLARLRGDDRRYAGFQNPGLLAGDRSDGIAEECLVIERNRRDRGDRGAAHDISRVEPAAQPDFEQHDVGRRAGKGEKGRRGRDLEKGDRRIPVGALAFFEKRDQRLLVDQMAGEADALVETDEMRRDVGVHAVARGFEAGPHRRHRRAFAFGAGDVHDRRKAVLRIAHRREKPLDAAERQIDQLRMKPAEALQNPVAGWRRHCAALKSGRAAICGRAAAGGCGFRSRPRIRANVACNSARGTTWSTMPWSSKYSAR